MSDLGGSSNFDAIDLGATIRGFAPGMVMFGRYQLAAVIGRGGMGVVWRAHDQRLERDVALKFLPELIVRDKRAIADLKRETNRCLGLTHPHIIRVHDFVEDVPLGLAAIAMEFVDGENLSNLCAEREHRCLEVDEIRGWIKQLCEALDYAHTRVKVVHRDLKPANLMIAGNGELKVADFGVARSLVDSASRVSGSAQSGAGTLVYMSPQQASGYPATVFDDIYSLGATLYDLLSGRPPFFTGNIMHQLENVQAPSITERRVQLGAESAQSVPPQWEETIAACLAKEPERRPRSVNEVAGRLGLVEGFVPPLAEAPPARKPEILRVPVTPPSPPPVRHEPVPITPPARSQRRKTWVLVGCLIAIGLLAAGLYYAENQTSAPNREEIPLAPTPRPAANLPLAVVMPTPAPADSRFAPLEKLPPPAPQIPASPFPVVVEHAASTLQSQAPPPLAITTGAVTVNSQPVAAQILVRDPAGELVSKGKTPLRLELPGGMQRLVARYKEWPEQSQSVNVSAGEETSVSFEFRGSSLSLTSEPSGATVSEGKTTLGKTPLTLSDQPPGKRTFSISAKDYKPKTVSLTFEAGRQANETVILEKDPQANISAEMRKWLGNYEPHWIKNRHIEGGAYSEAGTGSLRVYLGDDGFVYMEGSQEYTTTFVGASLVSNAHCTIPKTRLTGFPNAINGKFSTVLDYGPGHSSKKTDKEVNRSSASHARIQWLPASPQCADDSILFLVDFSGDAAGTVGFGFYRIKP